MRKSAGEDFFGFDAFFFFVAIDQETRMAAMKALFLVLLVASASVACGGGGAESASPTSPSGGGGGAQANEGEDCGDDVAVQKKCGPGLVCSPKPNAPVSEHTPGVCKRP